MNKSLLIGLVVAVAATANAKMPASSQDSADGMSTISTGLTQASSASLNVVKDSMISTVDSLANSAHRAVDASVFVIEHPSQASKMALNASGDAAQWVLTTSGQVLEMSYNGSKAFVRDPIGSTSKALNASGEAIRVTVDASGQVLTASGNFLVDKSGEPVKLVMKGSGEVYQVSAGSVVIVGNFSLDTAKSVARAASDAAKATYEFAANSAKATVTIVGDISAGAVASTRASGQDVSKMLEISANMPANAFKAATKSGHQY